MLFLLFIVFAYLHGSIPFGKLVGQRHGVDIQKKGSGNIGFTNSLRTLGLKPAILVLIGDILKGFIPVKIALQFLPLHQTLIIATVAILAHIFPVWLRFKGGKGVATGFGTLIAINPLVVTIGLIIFLIVLFITKTFSISSILSIWSLPIIAYFISSELLLFYITLAIVAAWTHRENIDRIIKNKEKRF